MLVQHLVTVALGGGFVADALFDEVRSAYAYRDADARRVRLGAGLRRARRREPDGAYPEYHRVVRGDDGVYRVPDRGIAQRHRLQVGTIVSDASMQVK